MEPRESARADFARLLGGLALVVGWVGVYFAFQGHWLGVLLPLLATGVTYAAVRAGDVRARRRNAALREARLRLMKRLESLILELGDISEIVAAEQ